MADVERKPPPVDKDGKPKKICCACPDSKRERDECIVLNGQDKCAEFVDAHKACLRKEGFDV